ncbi:MAG: hypothetical protein JJE21_00515 [Spirochaetaceae bacterium]|nr:hypothetical protein [Spirochaetaceae bacterium]
MDKTVIAQAPDGLIISDMVDVFATYFEARADKASNALNGIGCSSFHKA